MLNIFQKLKSSYFVLILIIVLFFSFVQHPVYAEDSVSEHKFNKEFLSNFKDDFVNVIESPGHWSSKDILSLSIIIGTGTLLYAVDQDFQDWFQDNRSPTSDDISGFVSPLGKGLFLGLLAGSLYASGEIFDRDDLRKTALLSLESWLTSGVIVLGLKFVTGRARPGVGEGCYAFHPFSFKSSYNSFPSGDAASAFAVAATIADQSDSFSIDFLVYSLATLVGIYRIHDNKHWASDVFVGSSIGYFVGKKISDLRRRQDSKDFRIGFQFSPNEQSLSISFCF